MQSMHGDQDLYRHPAYTYIPVHLNMCYIASYYTFLRHITCYIEKNPVPCNICYRTGYTKKKGYITGYLT